MVAVDGRRTAGDQLEGKALVAEIDHAAVEFLAKRQSVAPEHEIAAGFDDHIAAALGSAIRRLKARQVDSSAIFTSTGVSSPLPRRQEKCPDLTVARADADNLSEVVDARRGRERPTGCGNEAAEIDRHAVAPQDRTRAAKVRIA